MFTRPNSRSWKLMPMAVLFSLAAACSDDDATGPDADTLVGAWNVTSLQAFGVDVIDLGTTMVVTLTDNDNYSIVITGDILEMCATAVGCTQTGSYSATSTQITLDPGLATEIIFDYSLSGTTMTATGNVNGTPINMILRKS